MKKIVTEFVVDESTLESDGLMEILCFNFSKDTGFAHGQFIATDYSELELNGKYPVINSLRGKKVRITLEVIE